METKGHIRKSALRCRDEMPEEMRREKSLAIMKKILEDPWYREADILLSYVSYRSEVDTRELMSNALEEGKGLYCPRVKGETMEFFRISSLDELEEGYRGIQEPREKEENRFLPGMAAEKKCLMLLPGSAFDRERNRIGYGKGYYDRYLEMLAQKGMAVRTMGICFACQLQDAIPADRHDRKPDCVVTEERIYGKQEEEPG